MLFWKLSYVDGSGVAHSDWVHPVEKDVKIKISKESGQVYYRRHLEGTLTFFNDRRTGYYEYNIIYSLNLCTLYTIYLYKDCDTSTAYWTGTFRGYDCKFDDDRYTVEVTPKVSDAYDCLKSEGDIEKNILDCDRYSFNFNVYSTIEFIAVSSDDNYWPALGYSAWFPFWNSQNKDDVNAPLTLPPAGHYIIYIFARKVCFVKPPGGGWALTDEKGREFWYTNPPGVFTVIETTTAGCVNGIPPEPVGNYLRLYNACGTLERNVWLDLDTYPITTLEIIWHYDRNRKLTEVIDYLLEGCGLTLSSQFLQAATNPISGEDLTGLYIGQKSDYLLPLTSDPATYGMISINTLLKNLCEIFNLGYHISGTNLIIEHKSYYDNGLNYDGTISVGFDLTDVAYNKWINKTNKYAFDLDQTYDREVFTMMEQYYQDFVGAEIRYTNCTATNESALDHTVDVITTDFSYMTSYPEKISKDGFMLILTYDNAGTREIKYEVGKISGDNMPNCHLSWANLHYHYWMRSRMFASGYMNDLTYTIVTTFTSYRRLLKQIPISFPLCCETLDEFKFITTYLGDGQIDEATENLTTYVLTVTLKYD